MPHSAHSRTMPRRPVTRSAPRPPAATPRATIIILVLTALALLAAACGGSGDGSSGRGLDSGVFVVNESDSPFVPVIESTDIAVDLDRLVITLLDRNVAPTFADGATFAVRYFDPVEGGLRFREDRPAQAIAVDGETFYIATAPLDRAGQWELQVLVSLPNADRLMSARLPFIVAPVTTSPAIGDRAPRSPTLTLRDGPLATNTRDPTPDLSRYETSIVDALDQHQPFVVAFTTVGFCFGRGLCQRAVDQLKRIAATTSLIAIHAEPLVDIAPGATPVPSESGVLTDWNLESDPWIFVIDADGIITDRFEILVDDAELTAALERLANTVP